MLLTLDVHRAQKTDAILESLDSCNTFPICVPSGTTSLAQPLDVTFNKLFKAEVDKLANEHMQQNLESYVRGEINASKLRVLGEGGWGSMGEDVCKKGDDCSSLQKCGISVAIDGSEDAEIYIEGIDDYIVEDDDKFTDEDPF